MAKKIPQNQQEKTDAAAKWYNRFPWIGVLGSILIFLSWIFQNHFTMQATEERLRLDRSQISIDLEQLRFEQWNIFYLQERSKDKPDRKMLSIGAFKSLQAYLNLIAWSTARTRENPRNAAVDILEKNLTQDNLSELYKSDNFEALENDLKTVAEINQGTDIAKILTSKFEERYNKISRQEDYFTGTFVLTYIIGSLMIGWDFIQKR